METKTWSVLRRCGGIASPQYGGTANPVVNRSQRHPSVSGL
jgi:hypothetical protein